MNAINFKRALGSALVVFGSVAATLAHAQATDLTEAEVRKVDKETRKITLKHGPIKNLDMPGMTMVFNVSDPKLLDKVQAGDKIRFAAVSEGGKYVVTEIQPSR